MVGLAYGLAVGLNGPEEEDKSPKAAKQIGKPSLLNPQFYAVLPMGIHTTQSKGRNVTTAFFFDKFASFCTKFLTSS